MNQQQSRSILGHECHPIPFISLAAQSLIRSEIKSGSRVLRGCRGFIPRADANRGLKREKAINGRRSGIAQDCEASARATKRAWRTGPGMPATAPRPTRLRLPTCNQVGPIRRQRRRSSSDRIGVSTRTRDANGREGSRTTPKLIAVLVGVIGARIGYARLIPITFRWERYAEPEGDSLCLSISSPSPRLRLVLAIYPSSSLLPFLRSSSSFHPSYPFPCPIIPTDPLPPSAKHHYSADVTMIHHRQRLSHALRLTVPSPHHAPPCCPSPHRFLAPERTPPLPPLSPARACVPAGAEGAAICSWIMLWRR